MSHYVYILETKNRKYYTGYTVDLQHRMGQHRSGQGSKFVRAFGFKRLLYHEIYKTKSGAMKREAELKSWSRAQKQALICHKKMAKVTPAKAGSLQVPASV